METNNHILLKEIEQYSEKILTNEAVYYDKNNIFPKDIIQYFFKQNIFELLLKNIDDYKDFLQIIKIVSKCFASVGSILLTQGAFGIWPIYKFGTDSQKNRYLQNLLNGNIFASFALHEPDSGSDIDCIKTVAKKYQNGWKICGNKTFISNAPISSLFLIVAKIENKDDIGIFLVDRNISGLYISSPEDKIGIKALPVSNLYLDNVVISEDKLLGNSLSGKKYVTDIMNKIKLSISAQAIGIAQASLEKGLIYANYTRRFGQRLIDLTDNQFQLAELDTYITAADSLLNQIIEKEENNSLKISMIKLFASDVAIKTTETIIQMSGGYGYMKDNDIERYARDAKVTAIYGGSSSTQKKIISLPWVKNERK